MIYVILIYNLWFTREGVKQEKVHKKYCATKYFYCKLLI